MPGSDGGGGGGGGVSILEVDVASCLFVCLVCPLVAKGGGGGGSAVEGQRRGAE